jgi:hypothetical protein
MYQARDWQTSNGGASRKSSNAKSRMKKLWREIRARRRGLSLGASQVASSYWSTDRYQMAQYVG